MELNQEYKVVKEFVYYMVDPFTEGMMFCDEAISEYNENNIGYDEAEGIVFLKPGSIVKFDYACEDDVYIMYYKKDGVSEYIAVQALYEEELENIDKYLEKI